MRKFEGKVALVTGGGRGIGRRSSTGWDGRGQVES
jgi:NAD(P)-dependent dehydrogenase (short-subunit alcohol dehydrogenase family)